MGTMAYCRFQNTLGDLSECEEHMEDNVSEAEAEARVELIAAKYGELAEV